MLLFTSMHTNYYTFSWQSGLFTILWLLATLTSGLICCSRFCCSLIPATCAHRLCCLFVLKCNALDLMNPMFHDPSIQTCCPGFSMLRMCILLVFSYSYAIILMLPFAKQQMCVPKGVVISKLSMKILNPILVSKKTILPQVFKHLSSTRSQLHFKQLLPLLFSTQQLRHITSYWTKDFALLHLLTLNILSRSPSGEICTHCGAKLSFSLETNKYEQKNCKCLLNAMYFLCCQSGIDAFSQCLCLSCSVLCALNQEIYFNSTTDLFRHAYSSLDEKCLKLCFKTVACILHRNSL